MKFLIIWLLLSSAYANTDKALSMVPRGKLDEGLGRYFIVKTKAGTKIQIEFKLDGKFKGAFGKNLNKGDEFEPGEGLLSLGTVAQRISVRGKAEGPWILESDKDLGWIYELGEKIVDAKSGKILKNFTK